MSEQKFYIAVPVNERLPDAEGKYNFMLANGIIENRYYNFYQIEEVKDGALYGFTHWLEPVSFPTSEEVSAKLLSKRELFAAMVMQGLAKEIGYTFSLQSPEAAAIRAVECADALIAELDKPKEET